jgi:hypothetical protein
MSPRPGSPGNPNRNRAKSCGISVPSPNFFEIGGPLADPNMKARVADLGGDVLALLPTDFGKLDERVIQSDRDML